MLEGLKPPTAKRSCKVGNVAATLSDKDKKILLDAVEDKETWPIKALSRALNERGVQLSDSPLTNHRSKTCACFG
jgi:hypothetical protein